MNWAEFYFKITTIGQLVGFAFLIIAMIVLLVMKQWIAHRRRKK